MARQQRDVVMSIRAKDEATRAFESAARAIKELVDANSGASRSAEGVDSKFKQVASTVLSMDKAISSFTGKFEQATASLKNQANDVEQLRSRLAAVRGQMDGAGSAVVSFTLKLRAAAAAGKDVGELEAKVNSARTQFAAFSKQAATLERSLSAAENGYRINAQEVATLERNLRGLGSASTFVKAESDALTASFQREAAAAEKAATAARRAASVRGTINAATDRTTGKSAADSASVFQKAGLTAFEREAAAAADAEAAAIRRLRDEINPLAAIEAKLAVEQAKLNNLFKQGKISGDELTAGMKLVRDSADKAAKQLGTAGIDSKGRPSLFGLTPNAMTNLSYQINDIFTQIASGTSITQTLAQQGGQIIQIFPKVGEAIAKGLASNGIRAAGLFLTTLFLGIQRAGENTQTLRMFNGLLESTSDGAERSGKSLVDAEKSMRSFGISAEDAVAAVRTFLGEGIDTKRMTQFARAAQDTADVLGIELKQATNDVAKAFTGGYEAVAKLDDSMHFLTATQREQIRTMYEEGDAAGARTLALDIYSSKMDDAAEKSRGPWAAGVRDLTSAWDGLLDSLSNTAVVQGAINGLAALANSAARTARTLSGSQTPADIQLLIDAQLTRLANLKRLNGSPEDIAAVERNLDVYRNMLVLAKQAQAIQSGTNDTLAKGREETAKANDEVRRRIALGKESKTLEETIAAARIKANEDLATDPRLKAADKVAQAAYVNQQVEKETAKWKERQAAAAKKAANEAERAAKAAAEAAKYTNFQMPAEGRITSKFGPRKSPTAGASSFHPAIDIALPVGTPVRAPAPGIVIESGTVKGYGNVIWIDHGKGVISKLAHLSESTLPKGSIVNAGQVVGKSGNSGTSTGPHLDFRIDVNGKPVDPLKGQDPKRKGMRFQISSGDAYGNFETAQVKALDNQEKFNDALDAENERRVLTIRLATEQNGLEGTALIEAQKRAFVQEALASKEQQAQQQGLEFTLAQKVLTAALAAQEFEATRGVKERTDLRKEELRTQRQQREESLSNLQSIKQELQSQMEFLRENGQAGAANAMQPQLDAINARIQIAIDKMREFYATVEGDPEKMKALGITAEQLELIRLKLTAASQATQQLGTFMGISLGTIAQNFAQGATSAFDRFAQSVAEGKNVFQSLGQAFLQFAADFLRQIAQMIMQQLIFNMVSGVLKSIGGSLGGIGGGIGGGIATSASTNLSSAGSLVSGLRFHGGGVVGDASTYGASSGTISVNPAWFQNAVRYHTGGIVGLKPDEQAAVLRRGEEVLTEQDPRHRKNGGGNNPVNVKVINAIDAGDMVQQGMASRSGEQAVLNFIRNNRSAVAQALK